jgi:Secretion system C-terminal sorting domain
VGTGASLIPAGLRLESFHNDINLVAAVQEATRLNLPPTTAFKWDKNLVLDLNSHYINYSLSKPYQCEAYVNVYTQPAGTAKQEMFATLLVNPDIPIPNNGNEITHVRPEFQFGADSLYIWGLMGHTHKYGTGYKVWKRLSNGQKGELIYDASCPMGIPGCPSPYYDYQHIPLRYWEPLLPLKWGNGLVHEAKWVNDGPNSVNFGPTSDDEMMVLIAFYTENPVVFTDTDNPEAAQNSLTIAPNPVQNEVLITLEDNTSIRQIQVFDLAGKVMYQAFDTQSNTHQLSIQDWPAGIYFIAADGYQGKLIKQ